MNRLLLKMFTDDKVGADIDVPCSHILTNPLSQRFSIVRTQRDYASALGLGRFFTVRRISLYFLPDDWRYLMAQYEHPGYKTSATNFATREDRTTRRTIL